MTIEDILGFQKFWEFVIERSREKDFNVLNENKKDGKLDYKKLIEIFPTVTEPYGGYLFYSSNLLPSEEDLKKMNCNLSEEEKNLIFSQLKETLETLENSINPTDEGWFEDVISLIEFNMNLKYDYDALASEREFCIQNLISFVKAGYIESFDELISVLIGTVRKTLVCISES